MRVVLCDDHPVFTDGLAMLLRDLGVDVVETAGSGEELLALPMPGVDAAVVDLHLPGIDGIEATARLRRPRPDIAVLVLSMLDDGDVLARALRAGARGFLLKGARGVDVHRALVMVCSGSLVVDAALVGHLVAALRPDPSAFPMLTPREREVVDALVRGRSTEAIAASLFLTPKTVRNIVSAVLTKTGSRDRAALVARARDAGS